MKDVDFKLISELMKNSRRSDRDLAKIIGVSQPTVTRVRNKLEKEGIIKEYTMIPSFSKLGYKILSLTFVKLRKGLDKEEVAKAREIAKERLKKASFGLAMLERGMGLGYNGVVMSYHKNYASYLEFMRGLEEYTFLEIRETESFLINLDDPVHYASLTLASLARHVLKLKEKRE